MTAIDFLLRFARFASSPSSWSQESNFPQLFPDIRQEGQGRAGKWLDFFLLLCIALITAGQCTDLDFESVLIFFFFLLVATTERSLYLFTSEERQLTLASCVAMTLIHEMSLL